MQALACLILPPQQNSSERGQVRKRRHKQTILRRLVKQLPCSFGPLRRLPRRFPLCWIPYCWILCCLFYHQNPI